MTILLWGFSWFLLAFLLHLGIWKIRVPKRPFKVLFLVFLCFALFGTIIWWLNPLSYFPEVGVVFLHAELLFLCLGFSYMFFYQGIKTKSLSMTMLMTVEKSGAKGVDRFTFNNIINNDQWITPRIKFLAKSGVAYIRDGKYQLTWKGRLYADSFSWYRKFLKLSEYGG